MANNFWFKFYFKEWADDVKPLSLAARGLLVELIIHLRKCSGEMPIDIRLMIRLTGATTEEINSGLKEFREHGIFDFVKTEGVEFLRSRKIIKELHKSLVNKENGSKGGNPKLKKSVKRIKKEKDNQKDNPISDSDFNSDSNSSFDLKKRHGSFKNILLTDAEIERLKTEFPVEWQLAIDKLSSWGKEKAGEFKKLTDHNLTIRRWVIKAVREDLEKGVKPKAATTELKTDEDLEASWK